MRSPDNRVGIVFQGRGKCEKSRQRGVEAATTDSGKGREADAIRYLLGRKRFMARLEGTFCAQIVYHRQNLHLVYMNPKRSSVRAKAAYSQVILTCVICRKQPISEGMILCI